MKLCECGCGQPTSIASKTQRRQGAIAGQPQRFILGHRNRIPYKSLRGPAHPRYKTGRKETGRYPLVLSHGHHRATKKGYVPEHVLVAESALGRPILLPHVIHHVDENRFNNSNANLVICENDTYHKWLHKRQRAYLATGHADWLRCSYCKGYGAPSQMYIWKEGRMHCHRACHLAAGTERRKARSLAMHEKQWGNPNEVTL